jgi:uncharacterized Zn finger protein/DNA-binding transcriptional regulator YiaG
MSRYNGFGWPQYISVGERRAKARRKVDKLRKKGGVIRPIEIQGRKIARSFWGGAWCKHLEKFSDYENRLPRGRSYARHGAICHLEIKRGAVEAMVLGTRLYNVKVTIKKLPKAKWELVKEHCAGRIGSLMELLQGRISQHVMEVVTDRDRGIFPHPREIKLECSCPDWAVMCKHVAAVLYGVGARLDECPELLFLLRGVDFEELISSEAAIMATVNAGKKSGRRRIDAGELSDVFGIEMAEEERVAVDQSAKVSALPAVGERKRRGKSTAGRRGTAKPARKRAAGPQAVKKSSKNKKAGSPAGKKPARRPGKAVNITAARVRRLRAKFRISRPQFARLLGVSPSAVANWEKKRGELKLQDRTRRAWAKVESLSREEARKRLD